MESKSKNGECCISAHLMFHGEPLSGSPMNCAPMDTLENGGMSEIEHITEPVFDLRVSNLTKTIALEGKTEDAQNSQRH